MQRILIAGLATLGILACSGSGSGDLAGKGGQGAADGSAAVGSPLAAGTTLQATIQDSISSRSSRTGAHVTAIVSRNVLDDRGHVVIPGGSSIVLTIAQLSAPKNAEALDGVLALDVTSLTASGTKYTPSATVGAVPHALLGRDATPAHRDVIVAPGTPITITLTQPLKISAS